MDFPEDSGHHLPQSAPHRTNIINSPTNRRLGVTGQHPNWTMAGHHPKWLAGYWGNWTTKMRHATINTQHTPFNGLYSRTTWVSQYQKGKISLDFNKERDDGVLGWQCHQLDHMQTNCTSLQTDNHINTSIFTGGMLLLFLMPKQQCQSIDGWWLMCNTTMKDIVKMNIKS